MPIVRAGHMIREHVRDGARLLRQFRVPLRLFGIVPFADRVEVVAGGQFGGHLEPRQRIAPSIAEQRLEIFVLELPIVEPWIPQHPPHHIVRQVMREARAQLLAGDVAVEAKIPELRDIAADRVADGEVSEVAVVRASKRIVVDEGIALEHLPPCEQVREVVLERVRQHDPVARVRRRLRQIVEVHVGVAAFEGARDRREHHREALGVPDRLVFGGEQQLMVEQEADVHIQPFLGEAFIERVEEAHVLVRRQPFAAFVAFADVVPGVGEPYVQVVDVRVLARIVDDELDHARRHFGVREIEARQDRRSVDELSSAVVLDGETVSFTEEESKRIYKTLYKCDLIDDDDKPTAEFRKAVEDGTFVEYFVVKLPEEIADAAHAKAVEALVRSVYDAHALDGMIGRAQEKISENTLTDNFAKREFKELWARINRKHAYTVSFSDDELRRKSIERINSDLRVSRLQYTLTVGGQKSQATRDEVQDGSSFGRTQTETRDVDAGTASVGVTYDLVGEVAQAAAITRRSAAAILAGIDANVFGLYRVNPEEFIKKAAALIVSEKATMVVEHISYHEIDDVYDEAIFTERMPDNASKAYEAKKNIQRFVFPDSDGERRFAEDMDAAAEVAVYAKLPRTFQIPTPVGNYAPDWAIAFKEGSVRHVFFIAETKGTMDTMELSGVENAKIACAKKLFNEMSTSDVRYHNVATYEDLLEVMGRMS